MIDGHISPYKHWPSIDDKWKGARLYSFKASIGKLSVGFDPVEMADKAGLKLLDFTVKDALRLKDLPFHHKDPFDRMLIAQSIESNLHIMTKDCKFERYDCNFL